MFFERAWLKSDVFSVMVSIWNVERCVSTITEAKILEKNGGGGY